MPLTFYYLSGSPFAWRVWLTLEHKGIAYDAVRLRGDKGETRTAEYKAINPRGQAPTIVDDGFALWESRAIMEYLEERTPEPPLLPKAMRHRAIVRRLMDEADAYLWANSRTFLRHTLFRPKDAGDPEVAAAREELLPQLAWLDSVLTGDFLAGDLSLADFAAYPAVRLMRRVGERVPQHDLGAAITPKIHAWMGRIEAMPYYDRTVPPHWKD